MKSSALQRACLAMVGAAAAVFASCGPEVLPPSGSHPLTPPERVSLFQTEPKKYELLGAIEVPVTPEMRWDDRGDSTPGFEALKTKASQMGGNGVLLALKPGEYDLNVGAGYRGMYYQVCLRKEPRTVLAKAIYVLEQ